MPAAKCWVAYIEALAAHPAATVDRRTVEQILHVSARTANTLMRQAGAGRAGNSAVIERDALVQFLRGDAGEGGDREAERRRRFAKHLQSWSASPRLLVEAPDSIAHSGFADLVGVSIAQGRIVIEAPDTESALQALLGLAIAANNEPEIFRSLLTT
jgi:hypothetical protein